MVVPIVLILLEKANTTQMVYNTRDLLLRGINPIVFKNECVIRQGVEVTPLRSTLDSISTHPLIRQVYYSLPVTIPTSIITQFLEAGVQVIPKHRSQIHYVLALR